jgi:tripartite-type tricarboxylate transporter receptor subunit TctC
VLCVHPSLPVKSVKELIALAKARPGQLNFGSNSPGSTSHMAGDLLKALTGVNIVHIPYKGGGPALTALLSGEVTIGFPVPLTAQAQIKAGRLRALAVTSRERSPVFPALPTLIEAGIRDFEAIQWYGALAPAGTSAEIVTRLREEIVKALQQPDVRERFAAEGASIVGNTPAEYAAFIAAELTKWAKVIKMSGAKLE